MPERFFRDDNDYVVREERPHTNSSSWFVPLLLLPIAFLAGWVTNGFVADGQLNRMVPGIETGIGGGPEDNNRIISPLPTERVIVSPTDIPSPTISPTEIDDESLVE